MKSEELSVFLELFDALGRTNIDHRSPQTITHDNA